MLCERFGRRIGQNQAIQFPIALAYIQSESVDLMIRRAEAMFDAGVSCGAEANMARYLATEVSWNAAEAWVS